MTYGPPQNKPSSLITVRPGPVLHCWENGQEVFRKPLNATECFDLIGQLAACAHFAHGTLPAEKAPGVHPNWSGLGDCLVCGEFREHGHHCLPLPRESVPFDLHKAWRDAARAMAAYDWHAAQSAGVRPEFPRDHIGEAGE